MGLADPARNVDAATAANAALAARALARSVGSDTDEYRVAAWLARHWLYLGRMSEAFALATELVRESSPPEVEDARVEALRVVTLAGSEITQFERALVAAEELVTLAARSGDAGRMLSAAVALAVPLERVGDSWQAERILSQALADHGDPGDHGSTRDVLSACNALRTVCASIAHLLRDTDSHSEVAAILAKGRAAGERAFELLDEVRNPAFEVAVGLNLAELFTAQGECEQALPLLQRLRVSAQYQQLAALAWNVEVNMADLLLRLGSAREALECWRRPKTEPLFEGRADRKLSQVNNLPCCFFEQLGKRSDHHGHDWQDPALA